VLTTKLVILVVVAFPITTEKLRDALDLEAGSFPLKSIAQISAFCPITSEDFNLLSNHMWRFQSFCPITSVWGFGASYTTNWPQSTFRFPNFLGTNPEKSSSVQYCTVHESTALAQTSGPKAEREGASSNWPHPSQSTCLCISIFIIIISGALYSTVTVQSVKPVNELSETSWVWSALLFVSVASELFTNKSSVNVMCQWTTAGLIEFHTKRTLEVFKHPRVQAIHEK